MRKAETEGKIKEAARLSLPSQSARGLEEAPCPWPPVPRRPAVPCGACVRRVLLLTHFATLRQSYCHGFA